MPSSPTLSASRSSNSPSPAPETTTELISPCGRFSFWVETDQALPVHKPAVVNDEAVGYIESEIGSAYSIHMTTPLITGLPDYPHFLARVLVDGQKCAAASSSDNPDGHLVVNGSYGSDGKRRLIFSAIELTEEEDNLAEQDVKSLGTIRVDFKRIKMINKVFPPSDRAAIRSVSEKTKKAGLGALTSFGDVMAPPSNTTRAYETFPDDREEPLVSMVLKYMPKELLQANGIMPRPPPASSDEADEDADSSDPDSDAEESAELLRAAKEQVLLLEARLQKRKRKSATEDSKEEVGRRLKRAKGVDGGVVDLTGSDGE